VQTSLVVATYLALCWFLDAFFENRPIQRFWFLETVARMPYFSYITMLHLYESLGWWQAGGCCCCGPRSWLAGWLKGYNDRQNHDR
jgi:hypothetical protein